MSPRTLLAMVAIETALAACQKSSEQEAAESAKATAIAEEKAAAAKRERESGDALRAARATQESQEAAAAAAREAAEAAKALAREHERYHVLLTKEIAWIDRRLVELETNARSSAGALRSEKEVEIAAHYEWRARLKDDLELVARAPAGTDWTALKTKIDHDLDLNRPALVPRSYEKSYGI